MHLIGTKYEKIEAVSLAVYGLGILISRLLLFLIILGIDNWPIEFRVSLLIFSLIFYVNFFKNFIFAAMLYLSIEDTILNKFTNSLSHQFRTGLIVLTVLSVISLIIYEKYKKINNNNKDPTLKKLLQDEKYNQGFYDSNG